MTSNLHGERAGRTCQMSADGSGPLDVYEQRNNQVLVLKESYRYFTPVISIRQPANQPLVDHTSEDLNNALHADRSRKEELWRD